MYLLPMLVLLVIPPRDVTKYIIKKIAKTKESGKACTEKKKFIKKLKSTIISTIISTIFPYNTTY